MSLFWRIALGFSAVAALTLFCQRLVSSGYSRIPPLQTWVISGTDLVAKQGENALKALIRESRASSEDELKALDDSGIHSWLVTRTSVVGRGVPPIGPLRESLEVLGRSRNEGLYVGFRVRLVHYRGETAALLMVLQGLDSPMEVAGRLIILVGIPLVFCFIFARRIAKPIERVSLAATSLANGDLSTRVTGKSGTKEVRRLESAFNSMAQELEDARSTQKRMLADLSHEIRSPLGRILLAGEMLGKGRRDPDWYREQIRRDVDRMNYLVKALEFVGHVREQRIVREQIDLATIAKDVLDATAIEGEQKGIALNSTLDACPISGNHAMLFGAIENLVRNSIRHSPSGTTVEVLVSAKPPTVRVLDRGPGVPTEILQKIFTPFYRHSVARERDTGGMGLGLAIVKATMLEHGGRAWAEPREGGGLVVSLSFLAE